MTTPEHVAPSLDTEARATTPDGDSAELGELGPLLVDTQRRLQALYALEPAPDVTRFTTLVAEADSEKVWVRERHGVVELQVVFPRHLGTRSPATSDAYAEVVEGVSHFVHLAERARTDRPTSHLELEFQAEVDKFTLLWDVLDVSQPHAPERLHHWLFERVSYLHAQDTELGVLYRRANDLAARLCLRMIRRRARPHSGRYPLEFLRRFFRAGLAEKIHLAHAA